MDTPTKIRFLRIARHMKQTDLSQLTGIAVRDISAIESRQIERWEQRLLDALGYTSEMDALLAQLVGGGHAPEAAHDVA